jgi:hypothetical protein
MAEHRDPFCEIYPSCFLACSVLQLFRRTESAVTILRERNRRFARKAAFESDVCGLWETTGNGDDPYIISTRNKQHNNNKQTHKQAPLPFSTEQQSKGKRECRTPLLI